MRKILLFPFLAVILSSCAGYQFRNVSNPFSSQGINSVAVPMFVNRSSLSDVTPVYTKEVIAALNSFASLDVRAGALTSEDAVVLGIISPRSTRATKEVTYTSSTLMSDEQQDDIGNRNPFPLPTTGRVELDVNIVILKRATKQEIDFFIQNFKFTKNAFPRTVFSKTFSVNVSYSIENSVGDLDSGEPVRGTKNRGSLRKALIDSGETFAQDFKEVLANAF